MARFMMLPKVPELSKNTKHNIDVVVDQVVIKDGVRSTPLRFHGDRPQTI